MCHSIVELFKLVYISQLVSIMYGLEMGILDLKSMLAISTAHTFLLTSASMIFDLTGELFIQDRAIK